MLLTPNYNFKKPEGTDIVNIDDLNGNFDIIDEKLFKVIQAWEDFKANGGDIGGDLELVKNGITSRFGYSAFTSVASCWTVKGGTITTPIGLNLAAEPGQWSALLPIKDNEMKLGNEHYRYSDIFVGNFSKSTNGYTKLPNGIIIQWGILHLDNGLGNGTISKLGKFPITFPNGVFSVTGTFDGYGEEVTNTTNLNITSSASDIKITATRNYLHLGMLVNWIAIGY